jgi:hypothetical protein
MSGVLPATASATGVVPELGEGQRADREVGRDAGFVSAAERLARGQDLDDVVEALRHGVLVLVALKALLEHDAIATLKGALRI